MSQRNLALGCVLAADERAFAWLGATRALALVAARLSHVRGLDARCVLVPEANAQQAREAFGGDDDPDVVVCPPDVLLNWPATQAWLTQHTPWARFNAFLAADALWPFLGAVRLEEALTAARAGRPVILSRHGAAAHAGAVAFRRDAPPGLPAARHLAPSWIETLDLADDDGLPAAECLTAGGYPFPP